MPDFLKALADCNALAVFVAAVASFVAGGAWYSPALLANPWVKEMGWSEKDLKKSMSDSKGMAKLMAACFVVQVGLSLALAMLLNLLSVSGLWNGVAVGAFVAVGFTLTTMLVHHLFERKSWRLFIINGGYNVVMGVVIGGILGVWPR